jgi:hypothetical protein
VTVGRRRSCCTDSEVQDVHLSFSNPAHGFLRTTGYLRSSQTAEKLSDRITNSECTTEFGQVCENLMKGLVEGGLICVYGAYDLNFFALTGLRSTLD